MGSLAGLKLSNVSRRKLVVAVVVFAECSSGMASPWACETENVETEFSTICAKHAPSSSSQIKVTVASPISLLANERAIILSQKR